MAASLPILIFHTLDDRRCIISFSPKAFRLGMARLNQAGYQTLDLLQAVDYLRREEPFPERSLVITFDDGYQTVYEEALPVLQYYAMSATVFLTVGEKATVKPTDRLPSLQGRPMLNWLQIREMQQSGLTFGAHSLTHPDLPSLPAARIEAEVCHSKAIIEDTLGTRADCFAYPYGRYDRRSRDIVRQHFVCACSDRLSLITASSDPYALERVDTFYLRPARLFNLIPTKIFPWYIWARSIARRIRRAVHLKPE